MKTQWKSILSYSGHTVHIFTRSTQARTWENEILGVIYHEVRGTEFLLLVVVEIILAIFLEGDFGESS